jgi:hypothetical protein
MSFLTRYLFVVEGLLLSPCTCFIECDADLGARRAVENRVCERTQDRVLKFSRKQIIVWE